MVSEPDTSYWHFRDLIHELTEEIEDDRRGITRLRQLVICLWILVSSCVDADNLEAPYRCCELALLCSWDLLNRSASAMKKERKARSEIVDHVLSLYLSIGQKLIIEKIGPHADKKYVVSSSVRSGSELDINLALFEAMGRSALLGLRCSAIPGQDLAPSKLLLAPADRFGWWGFSASRPLLAAGRHGRNAGAFDCRNRSSS